MNNLLLENENVTSFEAKALGYTTRMIESLLKDVITVNSCKVNGKIYMIDVKPFGIENFTAVYVLKGEKTALIEGGPASGAERLLTGLREIGVNLKEIAYLMVTHIHVDHWGGASLILDKMPNVKVIAHPKGLTHMANPDKLWEQSKAVLGEVADIFGKPAPIPIERLIPAEDGMSIDLGNMEIQVIETLGHAPHHVSYYEKLSDSLFPGETAGMHVKDLNAIIPATPPVIILEKLFESIDKLIRLNPKTIYYTHFGPADNAVEKLNAYAKQLRIWSLTINECLRNNEDYDAILAKLMERDPNFKVAFDYIRKHPVIGRALRSIIQGFVVN